MDGDELRRLAFAHPSLLREFLPAIESVSGAIKGIERDREKLLAVGKLAAGLAHELNNPAAAAARGVATLREYERQRQAAFAEVAAAGAPAERLAALVSAGRRGDRADRCRRARLDPLAASDREQELVEALERRGRRGRLRASPPRSPRPGSTASGSIAWRRASATPSLAAGLRFVGGLRGRARAPGRAGGGDHADRRPGRRGQQLLLPRPGAAPDGGHPRGSREHARAPRPQAARASRSRSSATSIPSLPGIEASGSELNQVLDEPDRQRGRRARRGRAHHPAHAHARASACCVEIGDDGPGIPEDLQARVFDAFFTTKPVGPGHRPRARHRPAHRRPPPRRDAPGVGARGHALPGAAADPLTPGRARSRAKLRGASAEDREAGSRRHGRGGARLGKRHDEGVAARRKRPSRAACRRSGSCSCRRRPGAAGGP